MAIPKFPELEEHILKDWADKDIFKKTIAKPAPQGRFVFYDGPPTANGMPHIGHVETRAFKDIIPRFKTMQGFRVERKAGWDTQGLPVELEVEKALGLSGKKDIEQYGIANFNAQAKESVWKYKDLWEKMTNRVGFWLDTDHPYITYQPEYIETLWWILKQAWDQKLLTQDYKVVPYCPRCGTALSSHEVAQGYESVTEPSVYIKFALVDEPGTFILAWTTTPWTLPGNVALAVDKKITYVKAKAANGEYLIIAKNLLSKLESADQNVESEFAGADLVNRKYQPLFDFIDLRSVRPADVGAGLKPAPTTVGGAAYTIVPADFVTTADGSGVVHTAVMYGIEDFELGQKLDLPKVHTVDEQGKFNELVKPWAGLEVRDAKGATQKKIIAWLQEHGQLYKVEEYTHDYPFCWRCKSPLLYYAKTSWFILMSKLRDELIANNEQINWYPNHIKEGRFGEWLREVKDWAISRERYWGTPIPIWVCDQCKHQECVGSYGDLAQQVTTKNKYILLRHGQSTNNVSATLDTELSDGSADLTPAGVTQAKEAAAVLRSKEIDLIYTSQFPRATQTATIIAKELGLDPKQDIHLNEFHIGPVYENKLYEEYHQQYQQKVYRFEHAPEGGETFIAVQQRMVKFIQQLESEHSGKTILIVSHADTILVLQWAMSFQPRAAIDDIHYPQNGEVIPLHVPASLFTTDGNFDPHRPFVDTVTWPCEKCNPHRPRPRNSAAGGKREAAPPQLPPARGGGVMRRIPEVADAWFDSGAMPFAQWHYPFENKEKIDQGEAYPADYISEAIDQTRGWFYTLLAISTWLQKGRVVKKPAYKNVIVLGHVNDAKGKKLSKSLGNYVDPMTIMDQYGADAVRWFMYTANQPWDPKNFDTKIVDEGVKKTFMILTNVVSFWQLSLLTPASSQPLLARGGEGPLNPTNSNHPLDRWIQSLLNALIADVTKRLASYDVTGAARALAAFVTDLSVWYVRRSRDRFKSDDAAVASATLQEVLLTVSKLFAPFTPFLAEQVYHNVGGQLESVHLENWPVAGEINTQLLQDMSLARQVVEQGHALRAKAGIKVRQPLAQVVTREQLRPDLDDIVRDELNVKEIHYADKLPTGSEWAASERVAIDTTITDELKEEGLLRDLVREVNALRKTAKLVPADEIIFMVAPNTIAARIVERFGQQFLKDVRAKAATPTLEGVEQTTEIELDGETATIGLKKIVL